MTFCTTCSEEADSCDDPISQTKIKHHYRFAPRVPRGSPQAAALTRGYSYITKAHHYRIPLRKRVRLLPLVLSCNES